MYDSTLFFYLKILILDHKHTGFPKRYNDQKQSELIKKIIIKGIHIIYYNNENSTIIIIRIV